MKVKVRSASVGDVRAMMHIINTHAAHGLMRHKNMVKLLESLPNYVVAEIGNEIVGVCGFKIWPTDGVEIISSAVKRKFHRQGIGVKMNGEIIKRCQGIGFKKFFVLTGRADFYSKMGFKEIPKRKLRIKTFTDCSGCPKNRSEVPGRVKCDEAAMQLITT